MSAIIPEMVFELEDWSPETQIKDNPDLAQKLSLEGRFAGGAPDTSGGAKYRFQVVWRGHLVLAQIVEALIILFGAQIEPLPALVRLYRPIDAASHFSCGYR